MFALVNFLQDSVVAVVPAIESGTDLILYLTTIAAGVVSGYAVKGWAKASEFVGKLPEAAKLSIIAVLSFLGLKAVTFLGIALPTNPLAWDPTMVNTAIAAALGWGVSKVGMTKSE